MTPRLKQLVHALYHPKEQRRVFALSRAEAEALPFFERVAVISITKPGRPHARLSDFTHVLRLSFADVDHLSPDLSARGQKRIADAFTAEQALQVLKFIETLPLEVRDLVSHCEGGYSRSCAIAKFLHENHGYEAEVHRLEHANRSIVELLRRAARKSSALSDDDLNVPAKVRAPGNPAALRSLTSEQQAAIAKARPRTRGKAFSSLPGLNPEDSMK